MDDTQQTDISTLSFEEALAELESIVRKLESGDTNLDDAINAYDRGAQLKQHCQTVLAQAKERVDKITLAADGSLDTDRVDL